MASRGGGVAIDRLGPIQFTAEQLLDAGYGTSRSDLNDAIFVLYSLLGDGPMLASEAKAAAAEAGIADRTLRRAKAILQVASQRKGFGPGSIFYNVTLNCWFFLLGVHRQPRKIGVSWGENHTAEHRNQQLSVTLIFYWVMPSKNDIVQRLR